jgi:hypothetical protein
MKSFLIATGALSLIGGAAFAQTPANGASATPQSYPVCKSERQDRCIQSSQATNMDRAHRMRRVKSMETADVAPSSGA